MTTNGLQHVICGPQNAFVFIFIVLVPNRMHTIQQALSKCLLTEINVKEFSHPLQVKTSVLGQFPIAVQSLFLHLSILKTY